MCKKRGNTFSFPCIMCVYIYECVCVCVWTEAIKTEKCFREKRMNGNKADVEEVEKQFQCLFTIITIFSMKPQMAAFLTPSGF